MSTPAFGESDAHRPSSMGGGAPVCPRHPDRIAYVRCQRCGRPHSVYRKFGLCRICLREMAHAGQLPGVTKSSW